MLGPPTALAVTPVRTGTRLWQPWGRLFPARGSRRRSEFSSDHVDPDSLHPFAFPVAPDRFAVERYLHGGQCVHVCPQGFYHSAERSCERCSNHCRLCSSADHCLRCNSSYYLSEGACAKLECGEGNPAPPSHGLILVVRLLHTSLPFNSSSIHPPIRRRGGGPRLRRLHGLRGGLQEVCPV